MASSSSVESDQRSRRQLGVEAAKVRRRKAAQLAGQQAKMLIEQPAVQGAVMDAVNNIASASIRSLWKTESEDELLRDSRNTKHAMSFPSDPTSSHGPVGYSSRAVSTTSSKTFQLPSQPMHAVVAAMDIPPQPKLTNKKPTPSSTGKIVEQKLENMFEVIRQERQVLLRGPTITINIGTTKVTGISKRAAMAVSSTLNKYFVKHPHSFEYNFKEGEVAPAAIRLQLITWVQGIAQEFETYSVPMQYNFKSDIEILRAARLLGMERYTKHILVNYVFYLRSELPSYEEVDLIEKNATSDKDPLWTSMVNHMCHDRYKGNFPDPKDFEAFLLDHPRLKQAMAVADAYFAGEARKMREIQDAEWQAREDERRSRWDKYQLEKGERITKRQEAAASLKGKLGAKGSGLVIATSEEAQLLRRR